MSNEWDGNLRVFFGRFLIVHSASNPDMDCYLGFTPPEPSALSMGCPKTPNERPSPSACLESV
ncbi:MAG: hypothetical protein WAL98_08045 [Desulfatiglandaceae bacterium]